MVKDIYVAPSSLTSASLIDSLNDAKRSFYAAQFQGSKAFNSLIVVASEMGVFLPVYESSFMNVLQKIYDLEHYQERRRTGKVTAVDIPKPQLAILGGCTPSYLSTTLPEGAWDQGFTSRTIFVFSSEKIHRDIFSEPHDENYVNLMEVDLLHDITLISKLWGKVEWTEDAKNAIGEWNREQLPVPDHPRLQHYATRRIAHCIKLCMVASVSRSSELIIRLEDYQEALGWLLEAEVVMPEMFKVVTSSDGKIIDELWHMLRKEHEKTKRPVREAILVSFLKDRIATHSVMRTIEIMCRSRDLQPVAGDNNLTEYIPLPRQTSGI